MPADEPAVAPAPDVAGWLGRSGTVVTSPARRCRIPGVAVEPRLGPWDLGRWSGRPFDELDLSAWRADPAYDAHGGESLLALSSRVHGLLDDWHDSTGRLAAITHAAVVKAMIVYALRAPLGAVWDVDVVPGSVSELHATPAGWRVVRVNCAA
ncbi:MAG: histidine phosphatase family protein [Actinomycetota bacterium]|nr:histidine phosphatase family protein [Actinomycetota bacterium]